MVPERLAIEGGDQLVTDMAHLVGPNAFRGGAVVFEGLDDERPIDDEMFMRSFVGIGPSDAAALGEFHVRWGPLILPSGLTDQPELGRLSLSEEGRHRYEILDFVRGLRGAYPKDGEMFPLGADGAPGHRKRPALVARVYSIDVQFWAMRLFQAAFETLLLLSSDGFSGPSQKLERPLDQVLADVWSTRDLPLPRTLFEAIDTAMELVVSGVGAGFGPRLELRIDDTRPAQHPIGDVAPTVLPAMCSQAIRLVGERIPARRCPKCSSWFIRQTGRARYNQHRTRGQLPRFCSKEHALAAAQKTYRDKHSPRTRLQPAYLRAVQRRRTDDS
jgi:hypothetical protein